MGKNRYDVKRGHFENIEGDKLKKLLQETFGDVSEEGDKLIVEDEGAISSLTIWTEGRTGLWVDIKMNPDVDNDTASETISMWNNFLEQATGFTAKERKKRAKKKAKEK